MPKLTNFFRQASTNSSPKQKIAIWFLYQVGGVREAVKYFLGGYGYLVALKLLEKNCSSYTTIPPLHTITAVLLLVRFDLVGLEFENMFFL